MLDVKRVEEILKVSGAMLEGHFLLTSGRHAGVYMQCARILQFPQYVEELARDLAGEFREEHVDVVVGPATGGIIMSYEIARQLGARNLFTERENGRMTFRRGFAVSKGERVLVTEDVITTGGTVWEVIDVVREAGGEVAGVALLVDRSNGGVDFGVKTRAAYTTDIVSYEAEKCPLCKEGAIPVVKPGSRR